MIKWLTHFELSGYFNHNHLFQAQHTYRRQQSADTAMTVTTYRVHQRIDQGEIPGHVGMSVPIECFDVVDCDKLFGKLETYRIEAR